MVITATATTFSSWRASALTAESSCWSDEDPGPPSELLCYAFSSEPESKVSRSLVPLGLDHAAHGHVLWVQGADLGGGEQGGFAGGVLGHGANGSRSTGLDHAARSPIYVSRRRGDLASVRRPASPTAP